MSGGGFLNCFPVVRKPCLPETIAVKIFSGCVSPGSAIPGGAASKITGISADLQITIQDLYRFSFARLLCVFRVCCFGRLLCVF